MPLPPAPIALFPTTSSATLDAVANWGVAAALLVALAGLALGVSLYTHYKVQNNQYADVQSVASMSSSSSSSESADGNKSAAAAKANANANANAKFEAGDYEFIVVGFGVAGASLAEQLGRQGRRVLVVERDVGYQERIVGELIQPGGLQTLRALGLGDAITGADTVEIHGYALYDKGDRHAIVADGEDVAVAECRHCTHLPYPASSTTGAGAQGRGWHYGRFVQGLRRLAQAHPTVTVIEGTVKSLTHGASAAGTDVVTGVTYQPSWEKPPAAKPDDSQEVKDAAAAAAKAAKPPTVSVSAPLTIVADGCFSMFRSKLSTSEPTTAGRFFGLVLRDCDLPFPNHGHVILADPTPVLAYPISSNEVRMLIDFPDKLPTGDALLAHMREKVLPQLPQALRPSFLRALVDKEFKVMPNRSVGSGGASVIPGAMMIGDALNMRHPLTGGGMTCALTDVYSMVQRGFPSASQMGTDVPKLKSQLHHVATDAQRAPCTAFTTAYYGDRGHNSTVNILADALYMVFGGLDADEKRRRGLPLDGPMTTCAFDLRSACFVYLNKRGAFSFGPTALLAALSRAQLLLMGHFFAVAFYAMYQLLFPLPTPTRVWRAGSVLRAAVRIFDPLLMRESPPMVVRGIFWCLRTVFWLPAVKD